MTALRGQWNRCQPAHWPINLHLLRWPGNGRADRCLLTVPTALLHARRLTATPSNRISSPTSLASVFAHYRRDDDGAAQRWAELITCTCSVGRSLGLIDSYARRCEARDWMLRMRRDDVLMTCMGTDDVLATATAITCISILHSIHYVTDDVGPDYK